MESRRLFIGLGFSHLANDIEPWIKKMKKTADRKDTDLYWTPPENYHVTLVFLGEIKTDMIPEIESQMQRVAKKHNSFKLKIRDIDGFPSLTPARVLYLGVQRSQALLDLQSELERDLKDERDHEPDYVPHLTIARLRNPKSCRDLVSPFSHMDLGKQDVTEITLFNSVIHGNRPVYEKISSVKLG